MKDWKIGVIGAGSMGRGIAQVAATYGHEVYLYDNNQKAITDASNFLRKILARQVEKGRMTDEESKAIFGRIYFIDDLQTLGDSQLVIEAIVEDLGIKKMVFDEVRGFVSSDTILATNTSSLSVSAIANSISNPEKVIGIHFFNPAPLMKLVEIIPAVQTSDHTTNTAIKLIRSWQKETVLAKDTPGFIVNRVARPFYGEALRIYDEGIADHNAIDYAMTEIGGFRMGPFTLMDYIGHDVNYAVTESVFEAFYYDPRYKPSFSQKNLVAAGWLGKKSGKGFYDWSEKPEIKKPDLEDGVLKDIFHRILVMLINEAADAVYYDICTQDDVETAMTKGVNYPKGLLAWANEIGIEQCVDSIDALRSFYGEDRYRCSPLLRVLNNNDYSFDV